MVMAQVLGPAPLGVVPTQTQGGRLSLSSTLPVSGDVTGATSIWFLPYLGRSIALWNSTLSQWVARSIPDSGVSVAIGTLADATKPYDVFAFDNSGAVAIEIGPVWTSTTARATNVVTTDGARTKSGDKTRRYLGTFMPTATTTTEDSAANRYLWNNDNRVVRSMQALDATASWTYTTATWRQARASTANQLNYVAGIDEDAVWASVYAAASTTNGAGLTFLPGVGVNSTSVNSATVFAGIAQGTSELMLPAHYIGRPGLGKNFLAWLEWSQAVGTTTWWSTGGGTIPTQSGIYGWLRA